MRALLLTAAATLGADHIKVGLGDAQGPDDLERLAPEFERLAEEARQHGTRVAFEPPAGSMVPTLAPAVDMVRAVGHPAGGLLVDIWHVVRSETSFTELVEMVPPELVFASELSDGARHAVGSFFDDTFDRRQLPGDGEFDVAAFVSAVRRLGFDGPWGLEIMSVAQRALPVEHAVDGAIRRARAVFESLDREPTAR